ncbi:phage tail protein [Desulfosporosinus sp. FKB]|uniref:phage tail protein n=1 Tax=Desulfosporosinus sp. FKB TaxID=1969835 RepID=UPI000B4A1C81|nr:phage tail protein [Desulfosporosinus sp. FKB]
MAENFYSILTKVGAGKIANAFALGTKVNITQFAAGDGNGAYYNPTDTQTALVHEVWRGSVQAINVDPDNPNWLVVEAIIPTTDGGFSVREAGIFDDAGDLIAVGKYPETYKPLVADGSAKDLYLKIVLQVSNTASVTLKVDPSIVLASKNDLNALAGAGRTTETVKGNADAIAATNQALATHQADYVRQPGYAPDTGTSNHIVMTLSPAPTSYVDGMGVTIKPANASTAATDINVNGLGVKNIVDSFSNPVANFKANTIYSLKYEATSGNFIVQGKGGGGTALPSDVASGKTFSNDTGSYLVGTNTKEYGVGDVLPLSRLTAIPVLSMGGSYVNRFALETSTYFYIVNSNVFCKYNNNNTLISSVQFNNTYSVNYVDKTYVEGNYVYIAYVYNNAAKLVKIDYTTMTVIWDIIWSSVNGYRVRAMYSDGTYMYLIGNTTQNDPKWGKVQESDGSILSGNTLVPFSQYVDGCINVGKYAYIHYNQGNIDKIDMTTNTLISTWAITISSAPSFNWLVVPDVDTFVIVKGNYFYKFTFNNPTPIYSISVNSTYNANYSSLSYGTTPDKLHVYVICAGQIYMKIRLSDGAIIDSDLSVTYAPYYIFGIGVLGNQGILLNGISDFWTLVSVASSSSTLYYWYKLCYGLLVTN